MIKAQRNTFPEKDEQCDYCRTVNPTYTVDFDGMGSLTMCNQHFRQLIDWMSVVVKNQPSSSAWAFFDEEKP